ncbi:Spx/MgsR family RNA polymerase-binding regulatory protein [Niallia sp. XMNu-256]|uniref:Spx/MgsR family RNA polymerase-binding regulatory protein n=1 Tax=Niallia sp. XMNu-256 TaxID=3082444 RepID=UPI0030CB5FBE
MTITVITKANCGSSVKAKEWFEKNNIPYIERKISKNPLTIGELKSILRLTLEGTDDILATKSDVYKEIKVDELSLKELLELIQQHKELLKSPIITDNKKIMTGFNQDEIRKFIPREKRQSQWFLWKTRHLQFAE